MSFPDFFNVDWVEPTPEVLAVIVEHTKGKAGTVEDEIALNMAKVDDYVQLYSSIGAQTAKVCQRNPKAIEAVKVVTYGSDHIGVFFRLKKEALRDICTLIQTPRKPRSAKQQAADERNAERLRHLAKARSA